MRCGNRPAIREKGFGIWQTWRRKQVLNEVRALTGGLAALGFKRGDHPRRGFDAAAGRGAVLKTPD